MRALLLSILLVLPVTAQFKAADKDGRIEIRDGGKLVLGWRHAPLKEPKGGEPFAASAFIHPLATPSGFVLTEIQPADHLHHFGVWWPWKLVEVDGRAHNSWELQNHEGRQRADKAAIVRADANEVILTAQNLTEITLEGKAYRPVIRETAAMRFQRFGKDGYQLDLDLRQQPAEGTDVTIAKYRYSGFSWRGPAAWTKDNSTLLASGGHSRDNANHQPAKWVRVHGRTPQGMATLLIMSAASMGDGRPELLRVWASNMFNGTPFVNLNPVVKESRVLKEEDGAVSHRRYRLIAVDREIGAAEADRLWQEWAQAAAGD